MSVAPGTLSNEDQTRLMTTLVELVRQYFPADHAFVLTVHQRVVGEDDREGLAIYSMGTVADPNSLMSMLAISALEIKHSQQRALTIETSSQTRQ